MLSATVAAKSVGCCGTQAMRARQRSTGMPENDSRPESGSTNRSSTDSSVDLPDPLGPVTTTRSPGRTVNNTRTNTEDRAVTSSSRMTGSSCPSVTTKTKNNTTKTTNTHNTTQTPSM